MFEFDSSIFIEIFFKYITKNLQHIIIVIYIYQKNHFKSDENTKNYEKMDFFMVIFGPL
jgi:hypothetical protein